MAGEARRRVKIDLDGVTGAHVIVDQVLEVHGVRNIGGRREWVARRHGRRARPRNAGSRCEERSERDHDHTPRPNSPHVGHHTDSMQPIGVHHVSINVNDVAAAATFYVDVLGLTRRDDRPDFGFDGAWLNAGDQQVHLIAGSVPKGEGQHFALHVADLGGTIEELRASGITISDASPVGTGLQAFLADPSGNLVELHQAR